MQPQLEGRYSSSMRPSAVLLAKLLTRVVLIRWQGFGFLKPTAADYGTFIQACVSRLQRDSVHIFPNRLPNPDPAAAIVVVAPRKLPCPRYNPVVIFPRRNRHHDHHIPGPRLVSTSLFSSIQGDLCSTSTSADCRRGANLVGRGSNQRHFLPLAQPCSY